MKLLQRIMFGVGCAALVALAVDLVAPRATHAVVAALVTVANTSANPVPVASATHLGLKPSQFVTLTCITSFDCEVIDVNGNKSGVPYTVPAGNYLVVTDVDWLVSGVAPGSSVPVELFNPSAGNVPMLTSIGIAGPSGVAGSSEHLTSGVVFAFTPTPAYSGSIVGFQIHGYLTAIQ